MTWFLTCLLFLRAQEDLSRADIKVDFTETVTMVNLPVRVWHRGGHVPNLRAEEVEVVENGVVVQLNRLDQIKTPLTLHFLFDLSTSNARHIYLAKKVVDDIIGKMKSEDLGKISFFSSHYQPLTDYTGDQKNLRRKLAALSSVGSTALYDGVTGALEELGRVSGNRVLILFSDGHDLLSHTSETDLMIKVKNYRIPIVLVVFRGRKKETGLLAQQTRFMESVAHESGGAVIESGSTLNRDLSGLLRQMRLRYLARYRPPDPANADQWRSLVVRINGCAECLLDYRRAYRISGLD